MGFTKRATNRALLQRAVDRLPAEARLAMIEGVLAHEEILTGAYTDREGAVCPMVAAHRTGVRAQCPGFAEAWDRFTGARRPRLADAREVEALVDCLMSSLLRENDRGQGPRAPFDPADVTQPRAIADPPLSLS